jgi:hypothetical protein
LSFPYRYNVLKKFDELSKTTKLYQSSEDQHELVAILYILHNLILMSKVHDRRMYSTLIADYKPLLGAAFTELYGKHSYSQIRNVLNSLDLSNEEWCELHWKRIKNAIVTGITIQEIDKIYDNISFLRNDTCKSLHQYRKYLAKKDDYIGIKKENRIFTYQWLMCCQ